MLMLILISAAHTAGADTVENEALADAIFKAEGGMKATYYYGIRSVKYDDLADARRICINTIRNNRVRYAKWGYKTHDTYLSFLQSRYCPTTGKLSSAERRLNGNWLRLVKYFLHKKEVT